MRICEITNDCEKVRIILDKDMLDCQYAEAIKGVCSSCVSHRSQQSPVKEELLLVSVQ